MRRMTGRMKWLGVAEEADDKHEGKANGKVGL